MRTSAVIRSAGGEPPLDLAGMTLVEVVMALAITSMMIGGLVSGYLSCTQAAVKAELFQAANSKALERLEQTRSAIWAPNRAQPVDQLVSTNFPDESVSLNTPGTTGGTMATIQTTIVTISSTPPIRSVHVDCVWQFQSGGWITNSVETIRAADQ